MEPQTLKVGPPILTQSRSLTALKWYPVTRDRIHGSGSQGLKGFGFSQSHFQGPNWGAIASCIESQVFVALEILVPRGETLPPEETIRIPLNLQDIYVLALGSLF